MTESHLEKAPWITRHRRWVMAAWLGYWLVIFLLTHIPMPAAPSAPQHADKLVHFLMYGGLAFLTGLWLSVRQPLTSRVLLKAWAIGAIYGGLDELSQIPLPSRSGDIWDFLCDAVGAAIGVLALAIASRLWPRLWSVE